MLSVATIITSPHNWLLASKWSSLVSKESRLQPSQSGLGVSSQQSLCYKSTPSCHSNHTATITSWCGQPAVKTFLASYVWVHHPNSNNLWPYSTPLNSRQSPHPLRVRIKQSKTDPFNQGVDLFLGKIGTRICPVNAIKPYLAMQGAQAESLFIAEEGKQLTTQIFSSKLNTILQKMKINASQCNTHSFRIGATTSAKEAGISDAHIQMLGRWKSQAYLQCITTSRSQLATLSTQLLQGHTVQQLDWSTRI